MNRTLAHVLSNLEGLIEPETGQALYAIAETVPPDQVILEIGSFKGKSTCYLAEAGRRGAGAIVHCIEPWDLHGNVYGKHGYTAEAVKQKFRDQVHVLGLDDRIVVHQAFAHEYVKQWDLPIGMLFIDGSHEYADVKQDYYDYLPFVVNGGTIVFDDYSKRNPGVIRFVNELNAKPNLSYPPLAIVIKQ